AASRLANRLENQREESSVLARAPRPLDSLTAERCMNIPHSCWWSAPGTPDLLRGQECPRHMSNTLPLPRARSAGLLVEDRTHERQDRQGISVWNRHHTGFSRECDSRPSVQVLPS